MASTTPVLSPSSNNKGVSKLTTDKASTLDIFQSCRKSFRHKRNTNNPRYCSTATCDAMAFELSDCIDEHRGAAIGIEPCFEVSQIKATDQLPIMGDDHSDPVMAPH